MFDLTALSSKALIGVVLTTYAVSGVSAHKDTTPPKDSKHPVASVSGAPTPSVIAKAPPITQGFGENPKSYKRFGVKGHTGLDIGYKCGQEVPSLLTAEVLDTGTDPDYGNFITLAGYGGERIILGHFRVIKVTKGQMIDRGQVVGLAGDTGNANGCHEHLEIHPRNQDVNNGFKGAIDPSKWTPTECGLHNVPAAFGEYICAAVKDQPVNAGTVAAILSYENRFNLKGFPVSPLDYPWPCSPAGACGPGQFIASTFTAYGVDGASLYPGDGGGDGKADRMAFSDAVFSTAKYLLAIAQKKPDPALVAAEYNCGPKCGGPRSEWPAETTDYVDHVIQLRALYSLNP